MAFFHRCECLDRNFSDEEWWEYLRSHPDMNKESVFECFGFKYSINDICINPRILEKEINSTMVTVMTSQNKKGEWLSSYIIKGDCFYSGGLCSYKNEGFKSENEAIAYSLGQIIHFDWDRINNIKNHIKKWRNEFRLIQLNLFKDGIDW